MKRSKTGGIGAATPTRPNQINRETNMATSNPTITNQHPSMNRAQRRAVKQERHLSSFYPASCDCCGHTFKPNEKVWIMLFCPTGGDFEISYAACEVCYPKAGKHNQITENGVLAAVRRIAESDWILFKAIAPFIFTPEGLKYIAKMEKSTHTNKETMTTH